MKNEIKMISNEAEIATQSGSGSQVYLCFQQQFWAKSVFYQILCKKIT